MPERQRGFPIMPAPGMDSVLGVRDYRSDGRLSFQLKVDPLSAARWRFIPADCRPT
jgi:hypothetical protein